MAIEALKVTPNTPFQLHAGHDLESLLHTMLALCTYTTGPGGQLRAGPTKIDNLPNKIKLNEWYSIAKREVLAEKKASTLEAFNSFIKPYVPDYWQDFVPYLEKLIAATWDEPRLYEAKNIATHKAYRDILKAALDQYTLEEKMGKLAVYGYAPKGKRPNSDNFTLQQPKRSRVDDGTPSLEIEPESLFLDEYQVSLEQLTRTSGSLLELD